MNIQVGTKLGPYELQERIGAGGMGEVFRAADTRLGRTVAVKVLLGTVATDAERLRRFEQEARTLAALNHPNILAVFDIGRVPAGEAGAGTPYLVSEFLEGETLRQRLDGGSGLGVRRSVEYAEGIARGLAAGHSKGIVHRDIKPENIFLTRDGRVKILDFGLAKLVQAGAGGDAAETLLTAGAGTTPGVVLGTVGYMSPEQVRGEAAEATSDIFSFGSVLYEMLSGQRAFKRDTAAETMTAVLREDPPELTESGFHGPPGLERIVTRCLEKDPQQRFQSASDLAFGIESLSGTGSGTGFSQSGVGGLAPVASKRSWLRAAAWPAVALAVVAAGAGGWFAAAKLLEHRAPEFTELTFQRGYIPSARFTKDGASVIYGGQFNNDPLEVYAVRIGVLQPVKVDMPSAALFAVSTGDEMAVGTEPNYGSNYLTGTLSVVPVSGGAPRPLLKTVSSASYTEDGKEMAATRFTGGKCVLEFPLGKKLYESSGYLDGARVSPDGQSVGFLEHPVLGDDRGWVAAVDRAGKVKKLTEDLESVQGLAWTPDGKELWYTAAMTGKSKTLYGVTMAGKVRAILGMPTAARLQDVGPNGRVLVAQEQNYFTISAVDATGKETPHLELYDGSVLGDISPDGKAVLFSEVGGSVGSLYRVVYRKTDGSPALTLGSGAAPRLSPDGQTVAAVVLKSPPEVVLHSIGAGETRTLPLKSLVTTRALEWFPDGKHLALVGVEAGKERRSYVLDLGSGELKPLGPDGFRVWAVAHDGRRIAGTVGGKAVIFDTETQKVEPMPGILAGDYPYRWTRDDGGMLVQVTATGAASVYRVDMATGKRTLLKTVEEKDRAGLLSEYFLLAEDEKSYATFRAVSADTLWMAEGVK
jgi:hypothetical protein